MSEEIKQHEIIPRVLLEILVHGVEKDKRKIQECLEEMNSQLNKSRANKHKARILWYIDNEEKTIEEKEEWLIENAKCKYYCFVEPVAGVGKKFVAETLSKIRAFESSFKSIKAANIFIKKSVDTNKHIEEAKVIMLKENKKEV